MCPAEPLPAFSSSFQSKPVCLVLRLASTVAPQSVIFVSFPGAGGADGNVNWPLDATFLSASVTVRLRAVPPATRHPERPV